MANRRNIRNMSDLTQVLSRFGEPFEHFCACVASNFMSNYIWEEWYLTYEPEWYVRTYEFIDAITVNRTSRGWGVTIDARKMKAHLNQDSGNSNVIFSEDGSGMFNAHASFGGTSVANMLPQWIDEEGTKWREPIQYTDATERYMSENMKTIEQWYINHSDNFSDAETLANMFLPREFNL